MLDVISPRKVQKDIYVAESQVGIENHDLLPHLRKRYGEAGHHVRLADPTLAAGYRDRPDHPRLFRVFFHFAAPLFRIMPASRSLLGKSMSCGTLCPVVTYATGLLQRLER